MVFLMFLQHNWSMTSMRLKIKKPKSTLLKSKSLDNFIDTSTNLINRSPDVTSPPPFYTKRPNKLQFPKFTLFLKRHFFSLLQSLFQNTRLLLHLLTIATPLPLETLVEIHLPQSNNTPLTITVLKTSSIKIYKSTR